ncbi:MAG: MATE family efflux transporter, partial [Rhizobiales bacterium]|nr:MATE family efflux transporter [Hyphomicrobiales bacterium]
SLVLVVTFGFGVAGVGWASFAAEAGTALVGAVVIVRLTGGADWPRLARIIERTGFLRMIVVNRDIMIRSFALLFAFGFFTAQSARGGDVALAANEILLNFTALAAFFLDGLAAAAEQFAGRAVGARYRPGFDRSLKLVIGWGFAVAALVSLAVLLAGPWLIDVMTTSPDVRAAARQYLPFAALVPLAGTLAYQMDGVFIGATWSAEMRNMMLVSLVAYLAAWAVLAPALGIAGLWIALLILVGVRGITLLWLTPRKADAVFPAAP